jgi:hypothetical protein
VRVLLATAGLFLLTGTAAAGPLPTVHTVRKSPSGPIEAIAQDGNVVAWLSSSSRACAAVHMLSPGGRVRTVPQPLSDSMTCGWEFSGADSKLAIAARISTALWTLHESGPAPFDLVLTATVGGPEQQLDRLAHASDGTGEHLGGVAGAGRVLAYSWVDVEYVDQLACLSGGSCQQKIADGGINVVTRTGEQPLPGAQPALQLAVSSGRIAYIPATIVKAGRPSATANSQIYVVDAEGNSLGHALVHGIPAAIGLSSHVLAVLTQRGPRDRISWFSADGGTKLGSVLVSRRAATQLSVTNRTIVYRVNRALYGVPTHGGRIRLLATAKTSPDSIAFSLRRDELVWAENRADGGRVRAVEAR